MTNNTEQRRALIKLAEDAGFVLNPIGQLVVPAPHDDATVYLERFLKAALAQREQVGELPLIRVTERYDKGWRVNGKWFDHQPTEAEVNEAYAAPAPALCTAEEAAEFRDNLLLNKIAGAWIYRITNDQIAVIINEWAKR
jgi:hypothetical protein